MIFERRILTTTGLNGFFTKSVAPMERLFSSSLLSVADVATRIGIVESKGLS